MAQVVQLGQINTTALAVADLYVQIVPPQFLLNGLPTNVCGFVGTATWGQVGAAQDVSGYGDYVRKFGSMQARKYDMGTQVATASLQGGQAVFKCVRVTDGTDTAASVAVLTNCITFTSKYTGTFGNGQTVSVGPGSAASSFKVVVNTPGLVSEVFDNITGSGNALWLAVAAAINSGQNALRGPSQTIVATAGVGTTAAATATYSLTGGTDGATTITGSVLVGTDTLPRKGMYAMRGLGISVAALCDCDDSTTWSTQVSFGLGEGVYMIGVTPSGDTISNAVTTKTTAGIDSYAFKLMLGDWVYFLDTVNGVTRLVSPQGYVVGKLGNLTPSNSTLNKQIQGIVGTQKSYTQTPYAAADLQTLALAGIDVICNPAPGGNYFACRNGRNTSSNAAIHGDNYTRMTNYIAYTIAGGLGIFVGRLQTKDERREAKVTLDSYFAGLQQQGLIGTPSGADAWQVVLDDSNNPFNRVALGYQQADVKVTYLSVVEFFLVNIEGGQTVQITRQTQPAS